MGQRRSEADHASFGSGVIALADLAVLPVDLRYIRASSEAALPHALVALEQFIRRGANGASMEAIATAANVSKRTLYSRFGAKTKLLRAAVEHGVCQHLRPIATSIRNGSLHDRLFYVGGKMLDCSLEREVIGLETLILRLVAHEVGSLSSATTPGASEGIRIIRSILDNSALPATMDDAAVQFLARHSSTRW